MKNQGYAPQQHLGLRLTRLCMLGAVLLGTALSLAQIGIDAVRESARIDARVNSVLEVMRESATEAAYNIDDALAQRVVSGLMRSEGVIEARLALPDRTLARRQQIPPVAPLRFVTDAMFGSRRNYSLSLHKDTLDQAIGELRLQLDTSAAGADFVSRSLLVAVSGLIRALVLVALLLAVFHFVLARPLGRLINGLSEVNANTPERFSIPVPRDHAHDELGRLVRAINALLESIRSNLVARADAEDQADFLRQFDSLTQLPNRVLFHDRISLRLQDAARRQSPMCLLLLDIGGFHHLNDEHGFEFGDRVLQLFASRLQASLGAGDQVARLSGDRFALMFEAAGGAEDVLQQAEQFQSALQAPLRVDDEQLHLKIRMGLSLFPQDAPSAELLLKNAENALSLAKQPGQSAIQFFEKALGDEIRLRHQLRGAISQALLEDQFELHYQPIFDARSGAIVAAEALLRWPDSANTRFSIEDVIRVAEESGQIIELGAWILRRGCRDAAHWNQALPGKLALSVNLSVLQLHDRGFVSTLDDALLQAGLPPQLLALELTETAVMQNVELSIEQLNRLRDRGLDIAVDDFGTGHSSLQYLKNLPITTLKIDRSFVRDISSDAGDAQIVSAILGLGHSLKKHIVAEGVSDEEQLSFLQQRQCDAVQGFLFSPAVPCDQLIEIAKGAGEASALVRRSAQQIKAEN